jgi:hypothetical protein
MFQYRPRSPNSRASLFVAVLLTAFGFMGSIAAMHEIRYLRLPAPPSSSTRERVVMLRYDRHASARIVDRVRTRAFGLPSAARGGDPSSVGTRSPAPPTDTAAASSPVRGASVATSRQESPVSTPRVGPAEAISRVGVGRVPFAWLDSASRDTIERLRQANEAAAWAKPARTPQSVVDAEQREIYRERAERIAEKRPYPIRGGGSGGAAGGGVGVSGSIAVPIFEPGPSKAQRRRDSVVHAGNVDRFARIFARLRERQDSMLLAAALDSGDRSRIRDSLARARGIEP